jgi:long-chain acyl-CoA synthetase
LQNAGHSNLTLNNAFIVYSERKCFAIRQNDTYNYFTFEQIRERVLNFSAGLVKLGLIPHIKDKIPSSDMNSRIYVVICGRNCLEWFLSDYACVFKSLVSVTIHFTMTEEDIAHILKSVNVSAVICSSDLVSKFESICKIYPNIRSIITMDDVKFTDTIVPVYSFKTVEQSGIGHNKYRNLVNANSGKDVLTLVYTSGSTGKPKGAMIPDVTWNFQICAQMEPYRTTLAFAPLAHVVRPIEFKFTNII